MRKQKNKKVRNQEGKRGGFTMVELVVAMSIFVVLLMVSVGVFVRIIRAERNLTHRIAINNNAGLILEQMVRDIRTGYDFCQNASQDNNDGSVSSCDKNNLSSLEFTNREGNISKYYLSNGVIKNQDDEKLTAPDAVVRDLNFRISQNSYYCNPWRITINMRVGSNKLEERNDAQIQTTVSSRVLPKDMPNVSQEIIDNCR